MTAKTEADSQVRKVLQTVKDLVGQPGSAKVNEATTRAHLLNPLLAALGYESIDDIEFEHYLPDGETFLDYRLRVEGEPRVSVEAKALDSVLSDKDAAQAVSYASILGDEWAVVTNAREWRLYHTWRTRSRANHSQLRQRPATIRRAGPSARGSDNCGVYPPRPVPMGRRHGMSMTERGHR